MDRREWRARVGNPLTTDREALVARWFAMTRREMPAVARDRKWPVHADHCFQRILLDNACEGAWRNAITPPAYLNASDAILERAIALGEMALLGEEDLAELNRRSLAWRGKLPRQR